jgi:hypothetical protein
MSSTSQPTLFSQLWAIAESTLTARDSDPSERLRLRAAFLSGVNAVLLATNKAQMAGGAPAVLKALDELRGDLIREAQRHRTVRRPQ